MSSARQTVVHGPSLNGFGKRPLRTPLHHVDFETGIGRPGASIADRPTSPVLGKTRSNDMMQSNMIVCIYIGQRTTDDWGVNLELLII